jgi:PAS domain S-box-containing protein
MDQPTDSREDLLRENQALRCRLAELEAEAHGYRTTFYSIADAVITTDAAGAVLRMNGVAESLTGWSEAEARSLALREVFHIVSEGTLAEVQSPVERVLRDGVVVGLANHTLLVSRSGTMYPIADSAAPIRNGEGATTGVVLVFRDQTKERAAQDELARAEERFRSFFDNAPVGKSMTAPDGRLLRVNRALADMLGYSLEELQRCSFADITHPDDLPESRECVRALLAGECDTWTMEKRYLAKDGHLVWTRVVTGLQRDAQLIPIHLLTHVLDIADLKRAQAELAHKHTLLQNLIESVGRAIFSVDREYHYTSFNAHHAASIKARCGLDIELGHSALDCWRLPHDRAEAKDPIERALTGERLLTHSHFGEDLQTRTYVEVGHYPIRNEADGIVGVAVIERDTTPQQRAEDALRALNEELDRRVVERTAQLEESNKELDAFSYSVSHDLRAPLRAIDGFSRILADEYAPHLDAEGKRFCAVIRENTAKMSQLIDDLLAFSRLGRAAMTLGRVDMESLVRSIYYELTTPETRVRIDLQVDPMPPAVADSTLMRQVWTNLLSNAIKFSSKRQRAVIRVGPSQGTGDQAYVVTDNGAGFDMQYRDKLFGVFQRLHSHGEFDGTGVGLALVARIVRRHGGRVWGEGKVGEGASFYFALPLQGEPT